MRYSIGCDGHKRYSIFVKMDEQGRASRPERVDHDREIFRHYLETLAPASSIALETIGHWYWMIDEIERAGHVPLLVQARKAKLMMGQIHKTDSLDAKGLATLLHNGTLPTVWIPPAELRDERELMRLRMSLVRMRTCVKNRIHACLAKYNILLEDVSDIFGTKGLELLRQRLGELPPETQGCVKQQLEFLEHIQTQIDQAQNRLEEILQLTPEMELLKTLPGVGKVLAAVISLEIGSVDRFPTAQHLASYAGTVPRVHSSGGKTYLGRVRTDVNTYLKWAFVEAANVIVRNQRFLSPHCHVLRLYQRIRIHKGHAKAAVACARHLAEASYWMLKKHQPYREPKVKSCFVKPGLSAISA